MSSPGIAPTAELTEDDSLLVANLPQALQPFLRSGHVTTLTEDGLDDDTSDLVSGDLLLEQEGEVGEGELGHLLDGGVGRDVELGSIREGSRVDSGLQAKREKVDQRVVTRMMQGDANQLTREAPNPAE